MPVKKKYMRKKKKGNKQYQKQKQSVNVNIKIDQSKKIKSHKTETKNIPDKPYQPFITMFNAQPAEQPNYKLIDMNQIAPAVSEPKFIRSKIPIHFVDRNEQVNMMMPTQSIFTQTDRLRLPQRFTADEYDLEDESIDESMSSPVRDINHELILEHKREVLQTPVPEQNYLKSTKSSSAKSSKVVEFVNMYVKNPMTEKNIERGTRYHKEVASVLLKRNPNAKQQFPDFFNFDKFQQKKI